MRFIDSNNITNNYSCYLKKSNKNNYLNLLCNITDKGTFILKKQEFFLEDIHYKYNFNIINENNSTSLNIVSEYGSKILLIYPNVFNYNFQETITFMFLVTNSREDILITPNEYASENETLFNCSMINYGSIKKCTVPISFFENKKSGYFYLYHSGISEESDYVPYYEANPIYLNLPPSNLIIIRIKESTVNYIGKNGIIYFITNYKDNIKNIFNEPDIENKISLNSTVIDENEITYNVTCKIWNPKNEYLGVFCQLLENLKGIHKISLNTLNFTYNNYDVMIFSENYNEVYPGSNQYVFPFLYSENQTIVLEEEKENYELRFKIITYNNEIIFLKYSDISYIILDNCKEEGKELNCTIEKNKLKENLPLFGNLTLGYLTEVGVYEFNSVLNINIKYEKTIEKEDIYLNITKLLRNSSDNSESIITYETNISSCPEIITESFRLSFNDSKNSFTEGYCYFKKNEKNNLNLLLLCDVQTFWSRPYQLWPISYQKTLENIHYKYNFIIESISANKTFERKYNFRIYNIYPNYINLTTNNTVILKIFDNIDYYNKNLYDSKSYYTPLVANEYLSYFKLNLDGNNLRCTSGFKLISCKVSKNHFRNKKSGYY